MKQIIILCSILTVFFSVNSFGQETKRKRVTRGNYYEEFYVLKENKKIKQGQYFKYEKDILDRKILVELGSFANNEKVGEWYCFYSKGELKSFGNFGKGQKNGEWKEYYNNVISHEESFTAMFEIQNSISVDEDGRVIVNGTNANISATGQYESNVKVGIWEYFDRSGNLIHKYDHSANKLLFSTEHAQGEVPYLGGMDRFYLFYLQNEPKPNPDNLGKSIKSKVVLSLELTEGSIAIDRISLTGTDKFAQSLEEILTSIPNDWIPTYFNDPVKLTWEYS